MTWELKAAVYVTAVASLPPFFFYCKANFFKVPFLKWDKNRVGDTMQYYAAMS